MSNIDGITGEIKFTATSILARDIMALTQDSLRKNRCNKRKKKQNNFKKKEWAFERPERRGHSLTGRLRKVSLGEEPAFKVPR